MFRAFDPATERLVAVKLFRLDLPPERVHQFVAELERLIAAALSHHAIASPLEAGIVGVEAYLAAEFVAADSLDIVVRNSGPAPVGHAIQLAAQLAGAIDYAAAVGISHGAIHPRDVLVSADETRMTGFGIAQALERVGVSVPLRRPYTAPEQIEHQNWGREADIFALAAISHELLTGRRIAGPGADAVTGLTGVAGLDVELARAVFARALAADPALRFETALQFVEALKQATDETVAIESAAAREPTPPRRIEAEARLPLDEPQPPPAADFAVAEPPAVEPAVPPSASTFDPAELDLASAETERYRDVESAPAVPPEVAVPDLPLGTTAKPLPPLDRPMALDPLPIDERVDAVVAPRAPASIGTREPAHGPGSALERSRSAMWPLILALVVGVAIGFAAGYGVGTRAVPPAATAGAPHQADDRAATALPSAQTVPPDAPSSDAAVAAAEQALAASPRPANAPPPQPSAPEAAPQAIATPPPAQTAPAQSAQTNPAPARTAASEAEAAGRILVRSTPAGARVYVDGRDRGETPIAVRDLEPGTHRVRIVRDGYTAVDRRVVISTRRPAQSLHVALGRAATSEPPARAAAETFVGALAIESRPTGAKVYLDGRLVGATPMEVPGVSAGSHVVRLEHDGYHRWSSAVRVVSGERNRVTASLEK